MEIYIHIPFCKKKCNYCAFYSKVASEIEVEKYISALIEEIRLRSCAEKVETIYFGGGTPSTLKIAQIEKIFNALEKNFEIDDDAEITIEINPGTVDEKYLRGLKSLGTNRLSIGVQSFNDKLLKILGRIHDSKTALETLKIAEKIFENISVDLMYGLHEQNLKNLRDDLKKISGINLQHVSIYGLEIEEGTKFFAEKNFLNLPGEEICCEMYDLINEKLPELGYNRYEISNYARKNFESRHNSGYWRLEKYLGMGAGAHSFEKNFRKSNVADIEIYFEKIFSGEKYFEVEEVVTEKNLMEEFCFLGLRMIEGISAKNFEKIFGKNIFEIYGEVLEKYRRQGMLAVEGDRIYLTNRGIRLSNAVLADFLL